MWEIGDNIRAINYYTGTVIGPDTIEIWVDVYVGKVYTVAYINETLGWYYAEEIGGPGLRIGFNEEINFEKV